jgi:sigma-B regulation protein RsbU (phosphoserine phosphatase)
LPLGIDNTAFFSEVEIILDRGDLVLFYTDALTEAADLDGKQLGETGLADLIGGLDVSDPAKIAGALVEALDRYRGGKPVEDDLTFLLFYHSAGSPSRLGLLKTLNVYAKVLGLKRV